MVSSNVIETFVCVFPPSINRSSPKPMEWSTKLTLALRRTSPNMWTFTCSPNGSRVKRSTSSYSKTISRSLGTTGALKRTTRDLCIPEVEFLKMKPSSIGFTLPIHLPVMLSRKKCSRIFSRTFRTSEPHRTRNSLDTSINTESFLPAVQELSAVRH